VEGFHAFMLLKSHIFKKKINFNKVSSNDLMVLFLVWHGYMGYHFEICFKRVELVTVITGVRLRYFDVTKFLCWVSFEHFLITNSKCHVRFNFLLTYS
jgi:hypothetical protein